MISKIVAADVTDEFMKLKEALQMYLNNGFDVSQTKEFLQTHIPNEVTYRAEILLDTLLNYLMEDARKQIANTEVDVQNAFFDADFRKRIYEWTRQLGNKLALDPDVVKYESDPRLRQGLITSGVTFVIGTGIAVALVPTVLGTIAAGLVTIILSAVAFKVAFDKANPKSRETVRADVDHYLGESEKQVLAWLLEVEASFNEAFMEFCSANGFEVGNGK